MGIWLIKIDVGRPYAVIGQKIVNGRLLFLTLVNACNYVCMHVLIKRLSVKYIAMYFIRVHAYFVAILVNVAYFNM